MDQIVIMKGLFLGLSISRTILKGWLRLRVKLILKIFSGMNRVSQHSLLKIYDGSQILNLYECKT